MGVTDHMEENASHLDFAGPFMGRIYLTTIDTHLKWTVPQPSKLPLN